MCSVLRRWEYDPSDTGKVNLGDPRSSKRCATLGRVSTIVVGDSTMRNGPVRRRVFGSHEK